MKKEILIALSVGVLIGLLVVGGILTANKALQDQNAPLLSADTSGSPLAEVSNPSSGSIFLQITNPTDLQFTTVKTLSVTGKSGPQIHLIIQTENNDYYLKSDSNGNFSQDISLASGSNDITITAISDSGDQSSKTYTVVYSATAI